MLAELNIADKLSSALGGHFKATNIRNKLAKADKARGLNEMDNYKPVQEEKARLQKYN